MSLLPEKIILKIAAINFCRGGYVFWVNSASNTINRGNGIETPSSTVVGLVNSGIGCCGETLSFKPNSGCMQCYIYNNIM